MKKIPIIEDETIEYDSSYINYEYRCNHCRKDFIVPQKMSEDRLTTCPLCGKPNPYRKVTGGTHVVYKGSGWTVPRPGQSYLKE